MVTKMTLNSASTNKKFHVYWDKTQYFTFKSKFVWQDVYDHTYMKWLQFVLFLQSQEEIRKQRYLLIKKNQHLELLLEDPSC